MGEEGGGIDWEERRGFGMLLFYFSTGVVLIKVCLLYDNLPITHALIKRFTLNIHIVDP